MKKKSKTRTTFRPNFSGTEESVSHSLVNQPPSASVSPLPYRHGELMSSSLPPSSPCRNSDEDDRASPVENVTAANAQGQNVDREKPIAKPKRGRQTKGKRPQALKSKGREPNDDGEGEVGVTAPSDEGKGPNAEAEAKDDEGESDVTKGGTSKKGTGKSKEGTGKERDGNAAEDAGVMDEIEQSEDEASGPPKKRGRLSKEVKSKALAIRQRYDQDLEALALESGKTVATLLEAVGEVVPEGRALNKWNAFQSYAVHPEGYGMVKKEEQSNVEFKKEIHDLYNVKVEQEDAELDEIMDWYKMELAAQTADKRMAGYSVKELEKFSLPFINRVCSLFSNITEINNDSGSSNVSISTNMHHGVVDRPGSFQCSSLGWRSPVRRNESCQPFPNFGSSGGLWLYVPYSIHGHETGWDGPGTRKAGGGK